MNNLSRGQIWALAGLVYVVISTILATLVTNEDARTIGFVILTMSFAALAILMQNRDTDKEKNSDL